MKKTFKALLISLVAVLLLTACGGDKPKEDDVAAEDKFKIGLVLDMGGVSDKSFNQSAWEGTQRFAEDFGFTEDDYSYLSSKDDTDYVKNLTEYAKGDTDVIIAVGYLFEDAMKEVAPQFEDKLFLLVDAAIDAEKYPNVISTRFGQEEGSFLVGLVAAKRAKEAGGSVGFLGGMEGEAIGMFQAGFEQGVLEYDPEATIHIEYAATFEDAGKGQQIAAKLYDQGATVIYHAAGNVGNGLIKEAKEREDKWVIGVDKDQYDQGPEVMLTSMIKRVDDSVYQFLESYLKNEGKIEERKLVFDLANDGIMAETSEGRNLDADEIKLIDEYAEKIKSGDIKVSPEPKIANGKSNK